MPDQTPAKSSNDWLTVQEACEYLSISEQTLFRWMRSGKVSYYKVGKSTRFKIVDLDLTVEKVVGIAEAEMLMGRCSVCGHSKLVRGKMTSTGNMYFKPDSTKFWVWAESSVPVAAACCPVCGNIQFHADTEKLEKLTKKDTDDSSSDQDE